MTNFVIFSVLVFISWTSPSGGFLPGVPWTPVIEIGQGKLRGLVDTTYHKYLGIPYARVHRRFKAPGEPPPWNGTFDAIVDRKCKQQAQQYRIPLGTERNCLVLNVYTPKNASPDRPVPVMMFIHGGGFTIGSGSSLFYGPERLVENVTINYRLGAFGFLCLGIEGAPGNAGLKDQVAALRWIKNNINAFGGDPASVTVFGESAGGASAGLLALSKMAQGLFHRAILESITALSPFNFNYDPVEKASSVAERLGYKTMDPKELLAIFTNTSGNDIVWATYSEDLREDFKFLPCAEKVTAGGEPFMTTTPHEILSSGAYDGVPTIIGCNSREAIYFVGVGLEYLDKYSSRFEELLPDNIRFESIEDRKAVAAEVREFYFGNKTYSKENVGEVIDFLTDAFFHFPAARESQLRLRSGQPVYNYLFSYVSARNVGRALSQLPAQSGAAHFDEAFYVFEPSGRLAPLTGTDLLVARRMARLWTDFAKTGNPTPSVSRLLPSPWLPSTPAQLRFYELGRGVSMRAPPHPRRLRLWADIYDAHGYRTNPTPSVSRLLPSPWLPSTPAQLRFYELGRGVRAHARAAPPAPPAPLDRHLRQARLQDVTGNKPCLSLVFVFLRQIKNW